MAAEPLERFVSTRAQRVSLDRIDLSLEFAAEEPIHTENSCKCSLADVALSAAAGLRTEQAWFDSETRSCLNLFAVP